MNWIVNGSRFKQKWRAEEYADELERQGEMLIVELEHDGVLHVAYSDYVLEALAEEEMREDHKRYFDPRSLPY